MKEFKKIKPSSIVWLVITIVLSILIYILTVNKIIKSSNQMLLAQIIISVITALSLNLIIGVTGQFSLGHAGYMAIGAYSSGLITKSIGGYPGLFIGIIVGIIISIIFSLIVAIPTMRLKGDYLAIATLGFAEIIRIIIVNVPFTNGAVGLGGIPKIVTVPILFIFMIFTIVFITFLYRSRFGRALNAIRDDEIASSAVGINVSKYRILAFIVGASFASIAGSLYANYYSFIQPGEFDFNKSIDILVIVVLGGLGNFTGSILAAISFGLLNIVLQQYPDIRMIIYSLVLILIMILKPKGLLGNYEFSLKKLLDKEDKHESIENK